MGIIRWGVFILLVIAAAGISTPGTSLAQTSLGLERMQVDLWAEFDRPEMLVIYRGTLPADLPLPATLTLRLPPRVEEPNAVAYKDGSGALLDADYSTERDQDWLLVTLATPTPDFQLEFYDQMTREGAQRSYTFVWPGDYPVGQLSVLLLPPSGASDVQTQPTLAPTQPSAGSVSYVGALGSLAEKQEARVTVSYVGGVAGVGQVAPQPGDAGKVQSAAEGKVQSVAEGNNDTGLIVAAGILVVALVIGGALWYTRRLGRAPATAPRQRRRRSAQNKRRASKAGEARDRPSSAGYCTDCGRPLRADDRFCGHCGKPVKRNTRAQE